MFEDQDASSATTTEDIPEVEFSEDINDGSHQDISADGQEDEVDSEPPEEQSEVEVDGKKYALPKSAAEKIKAERMMQADYTRKTQEVAEHRKSLESEVANFQKQRQDHEKYVNEIAEVVSIDKQLDAYSKLDWQGLIDQDQGLALKYQQNMRDLERLRMDKLGVLQERQRQLAMEEQQVTAKQYQDANAYFSREIQGWSDERSDQLMKYGVAEGVPGSAITQFALKHPAVAKILHKAELYDQIVKKQQASSTPKPEVVKAVPAAKVGGNANVKKDPAKMSDTEYAAYRRRIQSNRK